jgi:RES domain-containing protein
MKVYRITSKKYAGDISGTGAAIYNGRWNKKGIPVLYTGESVEIALLEMVVHTPPMLIPKLDLLVLEIPDDSIEVLIAENLPSNWKDYPAPSILAEIGENWINEGSKLALKVPSSISPTACNYILNTKHPKYDKVKVISREDFYFDPRLKS